MPIVRKYENQYMIFCPACNRAHAVNNSWTFNGEFEKPTFSPSLLVKGTKEINDNEAASIMRGEKFVPVPIVCHSFVTDGKIQYLSDCTHDMAGKTIELEEF